MLTETEFLTIKQLIKNYNDSLTKQERENIEKNRKETEKHQALLDGIEFDEEEL